MQINLKQAEFGVRRQRGVVLLISLIILVALTLASIALVRSVDTTNVIVGNLAFQQAATRAAERGVEAAICLVLEKGMSATQLWNDNQTKGYSAKLPAVDPVDARAWDAYWRATVDPAPKATPFLPTSASPDCKTAAMVAAGGKLVLTEQPVQYECSSTGWACTLRTDDTGNTTAFTVQRMCKNAGDPDQPLTECVIGHRQLPGEGENLEGQKQKFTQLPKRYYRITARVAGPRNTVSYVQTIVAK